MKLLAVLTSGLTAAGCLVALPLGPADAVAKPRADGPTYLFVINSRSGRISGIGKDTGKERLTMTFRGVSDHATQFADRPVRKAYVLSTLDLVRRWRGWFRGDPPNAVLSFVYPGHPRGRPHSIVLELKRPRYNPKAGTMTFRASHLHRQADLSPQAKKHIKLPHRRPPARFAHGSLFIDSVTDGPTTPCTPEPEARCPDANLSGVDWSGRDLSYAELDGANLRGANLSGASLRYADLSDVDLSGANLTNTNFADAHMRRATVTDATLKGTDFSRANLLGTLFPGADLGADKQIALKGAVLNKALLTKARLVGNDLSTARLKGATLTGADLTGANLSSAVLDEADLSNAKLDRSDLSQAQAVKAILSNASLVSVNASSANLSSADMSRATLTNSNLNTATLPFANLHEANLRGVVAQQANMSHTDMFGADLSGMDFRWGTITGSDLRQASWFTAIMPYYQMMNLNLEGTDFRTFAPATDWGLNLNGSNLRNTNWRGWDHMQVGFWGADLTDADLREMNPKPYSMLIEAKFTRTKLSGSTFNKIWFTRAEFRSADARNVHWDGGFLAGTRFIDTDLTGSTWTNKWGAPPGEDPQTYMPIFEGNTICPEGGPIPCLSLMP